MHRSKGRSGLLLLVMLVAGGVVGDLLGSLAARMLPVLGHPLMFGLSPATLNLSLLQVTFGMQLGVNLLGLLGLVVAVILWLRT